jgi:hypothetical protein
MFIENLALLDVILISRRASCLFCDGTNSTSPPNKPRILFDSGGCTGRLFDDVDETVGSG